MTQQQRRTELSLIGVVPARNEAENLPETIAALRKSLPEIRVIVVDDASTDRTGDAAEALGAKVIRVSGGEGKGGAMLAGFSCARQSYEPTDIVLVCDADLGQSATNLTALVREIRDGSEVAIAAFPSSVARGGGFGVVKRFARRSIERRTGISFAEPLSGQRAMRVSVLDDLPGIAPGFGAEVGMTLDLVAAGIMPVEIPVELSHRATGKTVSGFLHRARQGRDVIRALRGERVRWP